MAKHPRSLVPTVGAAPPIEVALPRPRPAPPWRLTRFLESERWLAALLLTPAVVLLALFIAYPFVMGVWLALSDASVGSPGTFVGRWAMWCAIGVNTWRGMPFFAITLLAGLQTINPDLHEAASLDGANSWQRFWKVTWPLLKPVTIVVVVFSVIQTFADFQLIYVL